MSSALMLSFVHSVLKPVRVICSSLLHPSLWAVAFFRWEPQHIWRWQMHKYWPHSVWVLSVNKAQQMIRPWGLHWIFKTVSSLATFCLLYINTCLKFFPRQFLLTCQLLVLFKMDLLTWNSHHIQVFRFSAGWAPVPELRSAILIESTHSS